MARAGAAGGGGGAAAAEREAFFASLPLEEFSPLEVSLRQVLLDWLGSRPAPFTFPLIEWIDRRLGGEVATVRDESGQGEIRLQSAAAGEAEVSTEAFFDSLPTDSFSAEEEALREAIFEFLAAWESKELAGATDLSASHAIKECCSALMPPEVKIDEWIERRIGGEIELRKDGKSGKAIIHLTPPAREVVRKKFEAMQREREAAASRGYGGKGKGGGRPEAAPSSASAPGRGGRTQGSAASAPAPAVAGGKANPHATGGGKSGGKKPSAPVDKEEWFAALPGDSLTSEEAALRQALLDWLQDWPRRRPGNKPASAPMLFQDAGQDTEVQKKRALLLPTGVSLRDWIDRRIGGEIELRKDELGQTEILLRGSEPQPLASGTGGGGAGGKGGKAAAVASPAGKAAAGPPKPASGEVIEDFFKHLPADEMTAAEVDLRQAMLDVIETRTADGMPPSLGEACKDQAVMQARNALMPPEVPLRQWLERRVGGEVEVFKDSKGVFALKLRGGGDDAAEDATPGKAEARTRFFEGLPEDRFSPEEESLREALLGFLDNWRAREPPSLSQAGGTPEVRRSKSAVLPPGTHVNLKDWIEQRMGGELEMVTQEGTGQLMFGRRGSLDPHMAAKKRPREDSEPPRGGKGAPGGRPGKDNGKGGGKGKGGGGGGGGAPWKRARDDGEKGGGGGTGKGPSRGGPSSRPTPRR